jgi:outer membrane protein
MKLFNILVIFIFCGLATYLFFEKKNEKKIAYINNGELFDSFKMSAELNKSLKQAEDAKKSILDSLVNEIKYYNTNKDKEGFLRLKENYLSKRNAFSEDLVKLKQSASEKIAVQINEYIKEYAEEKNYSIILGANGNGNLWYAKENNDITKEIIQFANQKYAGKK